MKRRRYFPRIRKWIPAVGRNDDQKRGAKPPFHIGRRSLGHHFPLEYFFNNPGEGALTTPAQDEADTAFSQGLGLKE